MDPLRIIVRVLFAYGVLLALVRLSGKRTVRQGRPFDLALALIVGDMVDDLLLAEVSAAMFSAGVAALLAVHAAMDVLHFRTAAEERV